tara:strand:- start:81 stop:269 length:189 start_codon:yes stop_codon:yes gene_type:complete
MIYEQGEIIHIRELGNKDVLSLCMVLHSMGSRIEHLEDYFMVYSITNKEKFIVTRQYMMKIS